jgi:heme/copper-type cytochrome/quinol oxidase subunit 2
MKNVIVIAKTAYRAVFVYAAWAIFTLEASAEGLAESKLATGTKKLIEDATGWMTGIAAIVGGAAVIYFAIRRSAADEMDQKKWADRIKIAIVSTIVAVLGSQIIKLIIGYYQ